MNLENRITCSVNDALEASGLGRTKFYELVADGSIETMKIGRKRLVRVKSLLQLLGEKCPPNPTRFPTRESRMAEHGNEQRRTNRG